MTDTRSAGAAFAAFVAALTEELEPRGWRQRAGTAAAPGVWTMSLTSGFTATVQVVQAHLMRRTRLPIRVQFLHGVGYEPATELLASLGLPTRYTVLADPSSYTADAAISLTKETDLEALAHDIAELASGPWAQFARDHAGTDLIDAGLMEAARPNALTWRVVHLAAAGEHDAAHWLAHEAISQAHRRSERKIAIDLAERLDRWLANRADGE